MCYSSNRNVRNDLHRTEDTVSACGLVELPVIRTPRYLHVHCSVMLRVAVLVLATCASQCLTGLKDAGVDALVLIASDMQNLLRLSLKIRSPSNNNEG